MPKKTARRSGIVPGHEHKSIDRGTVSGTLLPYSTLRRTTKPLKRGRKPRAKRNLRWEKTRELLHARAGGICEKPNCGKFAPLHAIGSCPPGEGAHKRRRWNGKKYDLSNLWWSCGGPYGCHQTEHRNEAHGQCPRRPA